MVNSKIRLIILCSQRWRSSIQSAKTRPGADCGLDHELLTAKFRLKLKKVGKTTRPFRYDLNEIPYNNTVEVTNRFKRLDLIDSQSWRKSVLNINWKGLHWSQNSDTWATWCEKLTHWKRPWCWERLKAGGEGDNRGWNGWMVSLTQWTWVWVRSRSWWWTGKPGKLQSMGSQRVGHNWATEMNWTWLHLNSKSSFGVQLLF